ncbi:MAG: hypothetical protein V3U54_08435 [Thermodesulfobacteriota bacterium]
MSEFTELGDFRHELAALIKKYKRYNRSHTPEIILANYVTDTLDAYHDAATWTKQWYGKESFDALEKKI